VIVVEGQSKAVVLADESQRHIFLLQVRCGNRGVVVVVVVGGLFILVLVLFLAFFGAALLGLLLILAVIWVFVVVLFALLLLLLLRGDTSMKWRLELNSRLFDNLVLHLQCPIPPVHRPI